MATMRHLIVSLLLFFFFEVSTIQAQGRCRVKGLEGWTSMGSYCYQYFYSPVTFNQALINCRSYGGTLASVISETQNRQITGLITAKSFGTPRTWLGAQRTKNYGSFKWLDRKWFCLHTMGKR
ncbi:galactose-specific lectin nattectin-like [Bombina bombina]|uniref:galactose-specific lectin nattectin-like n=1 Tax=Bombina bombina TaxID=8345 RepID=UPI00235AC68D|nr:galactose-specific lectin nattectin-like [Bombina bombina]